MMNVGGVFVHVIALVSSLDTGRTWLAWDTRNSAVPVAVLIKNVWIHPTETNRFSQLAVAVYAEEAQERKCSCFITAAAVQPHTYAQLMLNWTGEGEVGYITPCRCRSVRAFSWQERNSQS